MDSANIKPKRKYHYTKKTGRPLKYHPGLCNDLIKFFSVKPTFKNKETGKLQANNTPFLIHWTQKHKIDVCTPSDWASKYPEFSKAYAKAKLLQEQFLAECGLKGVHNAFMSVMALKNIAGWRDKAEIESTSTVKTEQIINIKFENMSDEELTDFILKRRNSYQSNPN
jgi:hypothetical protein